MSNLLLELLALLGLRLNKDFRDHLGGRLWYLRYFDLGLLLGGLLGRSLLLLLLLLFLILLLLFLLLLDLLHFSMHGLKEVLENSLELVPELLELIFVLSRVQLLEDSLHLLLDFLEALLRFRVLDEPHEGGERRVAVAFLPSSPSSLSVVLGSLVAIFKPKEVVALVMLLVLVASLAKIEVGAGFALEAQALDWEGIASVAANPGVSDIPVDL